MRYNPEKYHRRSIRLKGYDYAEVGAYFVTIVTQGRESLFGSVVDGEMRLGAYGQIVAGEWVRTADIRPNMMIDAFVVMPNHVHGIIVINTGRGTLRGGRGTLQRAPTMVDHAPRIERFGKPTSSSIPTIVRLFKSASTKRINAARGTPGTSIWQRNYYEHVVRDEAAPRRIREYILNNPLQWELDRENPSGSGTGTIDSRMSEVWEV